MFEAQECFLKWKELYSWKQCKLDNKNYGLFLLSIIKGSEKPLTININGEWGIGKTHFLRQLYTHVRFTDKIPAIYINAWESDFSRDPLLVLITEITSQLQQYQGITNKLRGNIEYVLDKLGKFYNICIQTSGAVSSVVANNSAVYEVAKDLKVKEEETVKDYSKLYLQQKEGIVVMRKALNDLAFCSKSEKVIVFIDELDRCRPNYAIELLETIKHIFGIDGYVFVVATDTGQLSHSIKAVYGSSFDSEEYLKRFFNRSAKIPKPNRDRYSQFLIRSSGPLQKGIERLNPENHNNQLANDEVISDFSLLADSYNLSLRKMTQVFEKFESIFTFIENDTFFDYRLMFQLIIEFELSDFQYSYEKKKEFKQVISEKLINTYNRKLEMGTTTMKWAAKVNSVMYRNVGALDRNLFTFLNKILPYSRDKRNVNLNNAEDLINVLKNSFATNDTNDEVCVVINKFIRELKHFRSFMSFEDYFKCVELANSLK